MAAKVPRERLIGTLNYKKNGFNELLQGQGGGLPSEIYDRFILRLAGDDNKNMTLNPTLVAEGPFTLLKSIQCRFGSDAWNDVAGTDLRVLSHFIHDRRGQDAPNTVPSSNSPVAVTHFSTDLYLPFRLDDMVAPRQGAWAVNRYKNSGFRIVFGDETDINQNAGVVTTHQLDNTAVDVYGRVWTGEPAFENAKDVKLLSRTATVIDCNNVARSLTTPIDIPNHPSLLRGILLKQYTDSPETPITSLVSDSFAINLIFNQSDRKVETTWGALRSDNQRTYGGILPDGYVYIDLADDGDIARLQDTSTGTYQLQIKTNAVANAKLRMLTERYMPSN